MPKIINPTCWIVTEGLAGTENQCIGVAESLGIPFDLIRVKLAQPWRSLTPYLKMENATIFTPSLMPPWPDLLLTSGRKSIAAARFIKKQSQGHTVSVHIQDPKCAPSDFDLIAVPAHDALRSANTIVTTAAPNRINKKRIETACLSSDLPIKKGKTVISVLIGGASKAYKFTLSDAERIADQLIQLDAFIILTCSRRTAPEVKDMLASRLPPLGHFVWDGSGQNPYPAMLGQADFVLATADSVSMISESCTAGKPTYIIPLNGGTKRIQAFHNLLLQQGRLRIFNGTMLETYEFEPLNDAKLVAEAIKSRFPALFSRSDV